MTFWDGLGSHFGSQSATKVASEFDNKTERFLDRSWKRSGAPKGEISILGGDSKSPRGGVKGGGKPLPQGRALELYL